MMKIHDVSTPVVVFKTVPSAGHGALGILRSLGRLKVPVYAVASNPRTSSFYSRYCREKFLLDIDTTPEAKSLQFLLDVSKKIGQHPILIPTDDGAASFVGDHAEALGQAFSFQDQQPGLVHSLTSKKEMYYLAKKHGLPTPEAAFPQSRADLLNFLPDVTYPIMLKAIDGSRLWDAAGQKMFIVRNEAELLDKYDKLEDPANPNLMLQEYIPGGDDTVWMFNGCFNNESECLLALTGKKIRQYPISRGSTSLGICLRNETVERATIEFMKKIGYKGILVSLKIAGAIALGLLAHGGQIQDVWIARDEVLEYSSYLRGILGGVDLVDQARERQDLAFADELLVEVCVKLLNFLGQGPRDFGLLDALGIGQFPLAKLQNLTVIERQGQHADEEHGAQHQPENSRPVGKHRFEGAEVHGGASSAMPILQSGVAGQKDGNPCCYA